MASNNIRFSSLFFFLLSLHQLTINSQSDFNHLHTFCNQSSNSFNQTGLYQTNRETLLSSLRNRSSLATYSNFTTGLSPNTVHGMFLCRGDITKTSCFNCVNNATLEIVKECKFQKEAFMFYEECMIRYSDYSFSDLLEGPYVIKYSLSYFSSLSSFQERLSRKIEELIPIVSLNSSSSYYLKDKERVRLQSDGSYTLDSMVQCSPDLDSRNCSLCLRFAFQELTQCCSRSRWAHIFLPKCLFRYNTTASLQNGGGGARFIKGNGIFVRILWVVMTAWVLAFMGDIIM